VLDPLQQRANRALFHASGLLDAIRLQIWDREGLTVTQLRLLSFLVEEEGLSYAELAERLYVTRPSVSALLERLERGGFIRREVAPHDRRGIRIWIEPRGRNAASTLSADVQEYTSGLMDDMTAEEKEQFAVAVERMVESGRARRARDLMADKLAGEA
jgi:DNA-binding MarR family transcriptional regulator